MNTSTFQGDIDNERQGKIIGGINIVAGVLSIVGNVIVISILSKRKRYSGFKYLLAHLSLCDLAYTVFQLIDIPTWMIGRWIYNVTMCKVVPSGQLICSLSAEGTIVLISIERFKGITDPLHKRWKSWHKKHVVAVVVVIWLVSISVTVPYFSAMRLYNLDGVCYCVEEWAEDVRSDIRYALYYNMFLFIGTFLLPVSLLAILHGHMIIRSRSPFRALHRIALMRSRKKHEDFRIIKLLLAVVVAFIICVLPHHIVQIVELTDANLKDNEHNYLRYFQLVLFPFHSAVNPIIYSMVDSGFRREVKLLYCCRESAVSNIDLIPLKLRKPNRSSSLFENMEIKEIKSVLR